MSLNNVGVIVAVALLAVLRSAAAAEDLRELRVDGQRGQTAEQARRDRYECHNWAVAQTGQVPPAAPQDEDRSDAQRERRAERIDRAIMGAAIGAGLGGLVRAARHDDPSHGVLAGAAVGAAVGAATTPSSREPAAESGQPSDYLRALTACLEGRGYSVAMPTAGELSASR